MYIFGTIRRSLLLNLKFEDVNKLDLYDKNINFNLIYPNGSSRWDKVKMLR